MKAPRIIFVSSLLFWLAITGWVIRTDRLLFGPVTFHWSNMSQSSAMFRWATAPAGTTVVIPHDSSRSLKIVVPKKFDTGDLVISTAAGDGALTVGIDAAVGKTMTTGSTVAGGTVTIPLQWKNIAVQTRTFNVELMSSSSDIQITSITLKLQ